MDSSYIGVRLDPPPHNIYDVRSFQRSLGAPFLLVFLGTNYLRLMIQRLQRSNWRRKLNWKPSITMSWNEHQSAKKYWCLTCFWTGWLFRMNHGDHFELLILELMQQDLKILWPRPGCSIHEPWPPIFSHSTLCLLWQPMRGDGGWRGSSHVQWLFSPQTPVWNCFPTWSSKINKDIQSKGSKWYPKWEVRIWSEANENVAHPRIIWFTTNGHI